MTAVTVDPVRASIDAASLLAPIAAPEPHDGQLRALDVRELAGYEFKRRDQIFSPWLCTQDLCMVFAPRGVGKTHFALSVAYAVSTGGTFAGWSAPVPRKVLYLDGELPGAVMQGRLLMHCPAKEPEQGYLRVFTPDLLPDCRGLPDLSTVEGQATIEPMIEDADVVIVDNLSAWARSGRENEAESWQPIADWLLLLRRRGVAVILIHHAGKSGQQRGTSKREDLLDVIIGLSRPADYSPDQGAVFVAEFDKARNLAGTEAESLELRLGGTDEQAEWTWRTMDASTYARVVALAKEGLGNGEIAAELKVNKSTVSRHMRKAREAGDVPPGGRP